MARMSSFDLSTVRVFLLGLQAHITEAIAKVDGQPFEADHWQKDPGEALQGNGVTKIL